MAVRQEVLDRSRLGRLLINRGLLNERQLSEALQLHQKTGQRLGEILTSSGVITEKELSRTLKHQQRHRYAAAFVAMAVAPFQTSVAMAAGATGAMPIPKTASSFEASGRMQALDDEAMAGVGAQGLQEDYQLLASLTSTRTDDIRPNRPNSQAGSDDLPEGVKVLGTLGKIFFPLANVLDAEIEIEGVYFDPSRIKPLFTEDGAFNINLPARIERLSFIDIRPAGTHGATMGSMHFEGIQFSENSSLVIRPH